MVRVPAPPAAGQKPTWVRLVTPAARVARVPVARVRAVRVRSASKSFSNPSGKNCKK